MFIIVSVIFFVLCGIYLLFAFISKGNEVEDGGKVERNVDVVNNARNNNAPNPSPVV